MISTAFDTQSIFESAWQQRKGSPRGPRVLFCPSFSVNDQFLFHDLGVIASLIAKGADVTYASGYTSCLTPYPIYGGKWHAEERDAASDLANVISAEERWQTILAPLCPVIRMEDVLETDAVLELKRSVETLDLKHLLALEHGGFPIGRLAMNVVRNMHLVSDIYLVPDAEHQMHQAVTDCLLYHHYFVHLVNQVKPDRIFSHDSFYYPWHLIQLISAERQIPFYNYYQGIRPRCLIYVRDKAAMSLDMSEIWERARHLPLTPDQNLQVDEILLQRRAGKINAHQMPKLEDIEAQERILKFAQQRPTAYFPANVVWDLSALDKEQAFEGFRHAVQSLVSFFASNPDYHLILKAHPDEEREGIPETVERLRHVLKAIEPLPSNVLFIDSKAPVRSFELYDVCRVVICHTSSSGMEAPLVKRPLILFGAPHYRGRGFTDDPVTSSQFFEVLTHRLTQPYAEGEQRAELAKRYFYHYLFSLSRDVNLPLWPTPADYSNRTVGDFLNNTNFNSVIESVLQGTLPFAS